MKQRLTKIAAVAMAAAMAVAPMTAFAANSNEVSGPQKIGNATGVTSTTGDIQVTYTVSEEATWTDDDGNSGSAGQYVVTIPTAIAYTGKQIGTVSETATYDVKVTGVLKSTQTLSLTAAVDNEKLYINNAASDITFQVTHNKTSYSPAEVAGTITDGKVGGTTVQDTVTLGGTANQAGSYTGKVTYTASLTDSASAGN